MIADHACITCKRENSYIGISKLFGKTKFSAEGIRMKFPALTVGFFIEYEIHEKYNFFSKNYLYPQNILLDDYINYEKFPFSIQLIFALYTEFATTETENKFIWKIFESLKIKEKTKVGTLSKIINITNVLTGASISENKINSVKTELIKTIQISTPQKEKAIFLQKLVKYVFESELEKD
jgi:hypothetical protein